MKLFPNICTLVVGIVYLSATTGCGRSSTQASKETEEFGSSVVGFSEETGLSIPEETKSAMRLTTKEAEVATFTHGWEGRVRSLGPADGGGTLLRSLAPENATPSPGTPLTVSLNESAVPMEAILIETSQELLASLGGVELIVEVPDLTWTEELQLEDARLSYPISEERTSVAIPELAVVRAAIGDFVYVDHGASARRRPVTVGARKESLVEILEGISPEDRVFVDGAEKLWILELAMIGGIGQLPRFQKEGEQ